MISFSPRKFTLAFLLPLLLPYAVVLGQQEGFEEIANVPQDVSDVYLPPRYPRKGTVPKVMYTFQPSPDDDETVKVSTFPPNLFTAEKHGDKLRLVWNQDVSADATEGGVIFSFPASQLRVVSAAANSQAQILEGFTNVEALSVSSDATLRASLSSMDNSTSSNLRISLSSDAKAVVVTNVPVVDVSISSDGKMELEAPVVHEVSLSSDADLALKGNAEELRVSSDARLIIDGDVQDGGRITSDGEVTVYGSVAGSVSLSSDGKLYVGGELLADVDASSDAEIYAPTCDTVSTSSDAECLVVDDISGEVTVTMEVQPFTLTGTEKCGKYGWAFWWLILACLLVAGLVTAYCMRRRNLRNRETLQSDQNEKDVEVEAHAVAVPHKVDDDMAKPEQPQEAIAYEVGTKDDAAEKV